MSTTNLEPEQEQDGLQAHIVCQFDGAGGNVLAVQAVPLAAHDRVDGGQDATYQIMEQQPDGSFVPKLDALCPGDTDLNQAMDALIGAVHGAGLVAGRRDRLDEQRDQGAISVPLPILENIRTALCNIPEPFRNEHATEVFAMVEDFIIGLGGSRLDSDQAAPPKETDGTVRMIFPCQIVQGWLDQSTDENSLKEILASAIAANGPIPMMAMIGQGVAAGYLKPPKWMEAINQAGKAGDEAGSKLAEASQQESEELPTDGPTEVGAATED